MTDRELLQAMDRMMDAKLQPVCDGLDTVDMRLGAMDERLDTMQTDIRCSRSPWKRAGAGPTMWPNGWKTWRAPFAGMR